MTVITDNEEESFLTVRVKSSQLNRFRTHCQDTLKRRHSDVIREMMSALCEGRLKIEPTEAMKDLYNEH